MDQCENIEKITNTQSLRLQFHMADVTTSHHNKYRFTIIPGSCLRHILCDIRNIIKNLSNTNCTDRAQVIN